MNIWSLVMCIIVDIVICFGIPLGYLVYLIVNRRENIKFYFGGVCAFVISQIILRLPILNYVLPNMNWYLVMEASYPIIYSIFLGITAGLFEETARFLGFKAILRGKRNVTWSNGVAFGMGHGGIEAMLLVGTGMVNELIKIINSSAILDSSFTDINVLISGFERIFAISFHIGATLIVLYGIKVAMKRYLVLAILIHGVFDSAAGILPALGVNPYLTELWCVLWGTALLIFTVKSKKLFKGDGILNEKTI